MPKKKNTPSNDNVPYVPRVSGNGARPIQAAGEVRNISPQEAAFFAQQNSHLLGPLDVTTASAAGITPSGKTPQLNGSNPLDEILGIIDEYDPYNIPEENIFDEPTIDNSYSIPTAQDPELKKALSTYGKYFNKSATNQKQQTNESEINKLFNNNLEKVFSTSILKVAQAKALEFELQGLSIEIDRDFNGDYILYKKPTEFVALDKDKFVSVGSGIYLDKQYNVWNLNTTSDGKKYLVRFGSISDAISTQYPENYSLVKELTQSTDEYQFSGTDLKILQNDEFLQKLGIQWVNKEKHIAKLTTFTAAELKNTFYNYAINISVTPIFKVS